MLVVTARPSEPNKPRLDASTNGAALASIGRSSENWIATGGRVSPAARRFRRAEPTPRPTGPVSEVRKQRTAMVEFARIAITSRRPDASCRAGYVCFMTPRRRRRRAFCRIEPERSMSATISTPIVQLAFGLREPNCVRWLATRPVRPVTTEDIEMFARKVCFHHWSRHRMATVAALALTAFEPSPARLAPRAARCFGGRIDYADDQCHGDRSRALALTAFEPSAAPRWHPRPQAKACRRPRPAAPPTSAPAAILSWRRWSRGGCRVCRHRRHRHCDRRGPEPPRLLL